MKQPIVIEVEPQLKPPCRPSGHSSTFRRTVHSSHGGRAVAYSDVENREPDRGDREGCARPLSSWTSTCLGSVNGKRFNRDDVLLFRSPSRAVNREAGVRNGKMVDPIALRVGAFDSWLQAAEGMAHPVGPEPRSAGSPTARAASTVSVTRSAKPTVERELTSRISSRRRWSSRSRPDRSARPGLRARKLPAGGHGKMRQRFVTRQFGWRGAAHSRSTTPGQSIETIRYARRNGNHRIAASRCSGRRTAEHEDGRWRAGSLETPRGPLPQRGLDITRRLLARRRETLRRRLAPRR